MVDPNPGDIRNAKVKFVNRDLGIDISGWIPVSTLVNATDTKIGTVSFPWSVNLGTATDVETTVGIIVDNGYYIRNSPSDNVVVTVYQPNGDFITGGGYIVPTLSVGTKNSDVGAKTNFGFNVKFNKSGTNLQGNMNIIFRRTEGGIQHIYQIKANSMVSLGVNATNPKRQTANYVSKTNITDITNPLLPLSLGGNKFLYVNMIDNGEPGSKDSISVVLVDGSADPTVLANIIYSSNWVSNKTQMMNLSGGNLVVHSGFNTGTSAITQTRPNITLAEPVSVSFNVKVLPNPTSYYFTMKLSSAGMEKVKITVVDGTGRVIEQRTDVSANSTIQIGNKYHPGIYIAEIIQGKEKVVLRLIKEGK